MNKPMDIPYIKPMNNLQASQMKSSNSPPKDKKNPSLRMAQTKGRRREPQANQNVTTNKVKPTLNLSLSLLLNASSQQVNLIIVLKSSNHACTLIRNISNSPP
ncbi:hypothetical protein Dimus_038445 [Dionaea muscipula]